jgi:hypothetical protein
VLICERIILILGVTSCYSIYNPAKIDRPLSQSIDPPDFLAHLPLAIPLPPIALDICAEAVLLALLPVANILAAVGPGHGARAFTLVTNKLALVATPIGPDQSAIAMHLVLLPLPIVVLAIWPVILASPTYLVLLKFAFVVAPLREDELALALLTPMIILSLVLSAIRPLLLAPAMLLIFMPVACVHRTIRMHVGALPVCLIIQPLSLVHVSICMVELSVACGAIFSIVTFILGAIRPLLRPETVSLIPYPLPCVHPATRESDRGPLLPFEGAPLRGWWLPAYLRRVHKHGLFVHLHKVIVIPLVRCEHHLLLSFHVAVIVVSVDEPCAAITMHVLLVIHKIYLFVGLPRLYTLCHLMFVVVLLLYVRWAEIIIVIEAVALKVRGIWV